MHYEDCKTGEEQALKTKLLLILASLFVYSTAYASESNLAAKECLLASGYTPEKFDEFDFSKAAGCYADWRSGDMRRDHIALRMFLESKPWYKGPGWDWEVRASQGWNCIVYHETGTKICRKPTFIE